jgi:hypothetical protein
MKIIQLENSEHQAIVDDEDFDRVRSYKWKYHRGYARHFASEGIKMYLHRFIMNVPMRNPIVDHINGDKLDCRRENLRKCSKQENNRNASKREKTTSSKYKGVYKHKDKWRAYIYLNKKKISLGCYENEIDAALAYDKKAKELFGDFAKPNIEDNNVQTVDEN